MRLQIPASAWRSPIRTLIKAASLLFSDGTWLSGHPDLRPLSLARDWPHVDALFALEQWPFVRADLEISHAQPGAVGFSAWKDDVFAGFYTAHAFGKVGYLDLSIVAPAFRRAGMLRPMHVKVVRTLRERGARGLAVHTTVESAPLIRILGFEPGQTFTLLARDPVGPGAGDLVPLGLDDEAGLVALDAAVFGVARPSWVGGLLRQPSTRFYGRKREGVLVASVCLRERRAGAVCLDAANATDPAELLPLIREVLVQHAHQRLECFVRDGRALGEALRASGFAVPGFFVAIGPLVEWREGDTAGVGDGPHVQSLSWF
jgi:hypothetical protein